VDLTNQWIGHAPGCIANQVFTPHTVGDDGVTMSIWRDDASMLAAAYQKGDHRSQLDRHKALPLFDRSSFTRFRILESRGSWNGSDPAAL
jgi:heme-degrading monooxygenase HmoA